MSSARDGGRNNFQFFTAEMNAQAVERLTLENELRLALGKKELFLVYQPQMDIATGKFSELEALLCRQHRKLGLVRPDKFIRIAENSGLIMPIGEWVLRAACSQARKWQDEGLPAVSIAINYPQSSFVNRASANSFTRALHETGLAPDYLELELTESLLLGDTDVTLAVLRELKAMGLTLACRRCRRRSANVIFAAHHCDGIQGYYFSKPLTVDHVGDILRGAACRTLAAKRGV